MEVGKLIKASSSSFLHKAAPTMSLLYLLCDCRTKPVYCSGICCFSRNAFPGGKSTPAIHSCLELLKLNINYK